MVSCTSTGSSLLSRTVRSTRVTGTPWGRRRAVASCGGGILDERVNAPLDLPGLRDRRPVSKPDRVVAVTESYRLGVGQEDTTAHHDRRAILDSQPDRHLSGSADRGNLQQLLFGCLPLFERLCVEAGQAQLAVLAVVAAGDEQPHV